MFRFLKNKTNREIISWLAGGVASIAAGAWAVYVYFYHPEPPFKGNISAENCSIATAGNVTAGGDIKISGRDCSSQKGR